MFFIDDNTGFLCYKVKPSDRALMHRTYDLIFSEANTVNKKTVYDRKESRLAGLLGEIVFGHYLGENGNPSKQGNVPYDFTYKHDDHIYKIDVKCKYRGVKPRKDFEASIFTYQSVGFFHCIDYYAFLSTLGYFEYVWFCGYANKEQWTNNPKGKLWKKGEVDPANGKFYRGDTWNVFYRDLPQFRNETFLNY